MPFRSHSRCESAYWDFTIEKWWRCCTILPWYKATWVVRTATAMQLYLEGIRRDRMVLKDDDHVLLSPRYQNLGELYSENGQIENSLQCFQAALRIEHTTTVRLSQCVSASRSLPTSQHWIDVCRLLYVIGNIHLRLLDIQSTMQYFTAAARISTLLPARGHQQFQFVFEDQLARHLAWLHPISACAA